MQDTRISVYGALRRFNREQEREADVRGFAYMASARYRPSAAAEVWRAMMNETDQTAKTRNLRSTRYDQVAYFATHPTNLERADYLSALANRVPGGEFDGRAQYEAALGPWLRAFLDDQIKLNDFGGTEYLLERLAGDHWSAELLYARAELYRNRGNPRDLVTAAEFYRQALALNPGLYEANRGLGLALIRSGSTIDGRSALAKFLESKPDAADAPMLRSLLSD